MLQKTLLLLCWEISKTNNTYSECVFVALDIHNEMRMALIIIYGLPGSTMSKNGTIFEKEVIQNESVFKFSLQLLSATFLNLRRNERDIINVRGLEL